MTQLDELLRERSDRVPIDDVAERRALDHARHTLRAATVAPPPLVARRRRQAAEPLAWLWRPAWRQRSSPSWRRFPAALGTMWVTPGRRLHPRGLCSSGQRRRSRGRPGIRSSPANGSTSANWATTRAITVLRPPAPTASGRFGSRTTARPGSCNARAWSAEGTYYCSISPGARSSPSSGDSVLDRT